MSEEPDTDLVYLKFEYSRVTIRHYAPGGNTLLWIFQVEDHLPELHSLADCAATATTLARHLEELAETMPVIARWHSSSDDAASKRAIAAATTRIARALVTLPHEADSDESSLLGHDTGIKRNQLTRQPDTCQVNKGARNHDPARGLHVRRGARCPGEAGPVQLRGAVPARRGDHLTAGLHAKLRQLH